MKILAFLIAPLLFLACTATPELGDPRYVKAQRACLAMNIDDLGMPLLKGDPLDEPELAEFKRKCKALGYEWVGTTDSLVQRTDDLLSP